MHIKKATTFFFFVLSFFVLCRFCFDRRLHSLRSVEVVFFCRPFVLTLTFRLAIRNSLFNVVFLHFLCSSIVGLFAVVFTLEVYYFLLFFSFQYMLCVCVLFFSLLFPLTSRSFSTIECVRSAICSSHYRLPLHFYYHLLLIK